MDWRRHLICLFSLSALCGCGSGDAGELKIAIIETEEDLYDLGLRMSPGAQHLRAATGSGLVALDAQGEVIPALADRWIVTDDGRSFIFRLREGNWPNGQELSAGSVQGRLQATLRELRGTSLGLDLSPIEEVRAMAGRVVEIRLSSPVPDLLNLLAQPELTLAVDDQASGPMSLTRDGRTANLEFKPPTDRGLPDDTNWTDYVRPLRISAMAKPEAIRAFDDGRVDVVLGGRFDTLPMLETGPLSRGTVRLDAAIGLFGMLVTKDVGLLDSAEGREAISMAIDRPSLIEPFGIGGWIPTTRVSAPGLPGDSGDVQERWSDLSLEERREQAARYIAAWHLENGADEGDAGGTADPAAPVRLTISMGQGPGVEWLYRELSEQLLDVGVRLEKVAPADQPDLVLIDRVARYAGSRWFLNQFNCSLQRGLCSEEADALVLQAIATPDDAERNRLLAAAEMELTATNAYIPFGSPLRWSLVRGTVAGFQPNRWAFHPLPDMASLPR